MNNADEEFEQPESFSFSRKNANRAKAIIAKYPDGRQASAVMPLLDLAQRQNDGWLPKIAMDNIAEMLVMAIFGNGPSTSAS